MSRHQFPGLDGASTVFIGWDRPMQTFFVQVLRPHPHLAGEEETVAWHGTAIGELAKHAKADRSFPRSGTIKDVWKRLNTMQVEGDLYDAMEEAELDYLAL